MRLVKQAKGKWQYLLNPTEKSLLKSLLKHFPFAADTPVKITRTDTDSKVAEREQLLNESLVEHRQELQRQALSLSGARKFKKAEPGYLFTITSGEREFLLQILNDIRVGCWVSLGKPQSMDLPKATPSALEAAHRSLMDLAGYFESQLVDQD